MGTPTIHVLSVGISIQNNLENANFRKKKLRWARGGVELLFQHLESTTPTKTAAWIEEVLTGKHPDIVTRLKEIVEHNPREASAELTGLAAVGGNVEIGENDSAVLLASDTSSGLTSALYNAIVSTGYTLDRIEYRDMPTDAVSKGKAVICRLPRLDVISPPQFAEAMRGLGKIGRGVWTLMEDGKDPAPAVFHLSGGYRPALPYLLSLAEVLRGVRPDVTAYAVAEGSEHPIRLPLRTFTQKLVEKDCSLNDFDEEGKVAVAPETTLVEGLVYTKNESGFDARLTPFGHALKEFYREYKPA